MARSLDSGGPVQPRTIGLNSTMQSEDLDQERFAGSPRVGGSGESKGMDRDRARSGRRADPYVPKGLHPE